MRIYLLSTTDTYTGLSREYDSPIAPYNATAIEPPAYQEGYLRKYDRLTETWSQVKYEPPVDTTTLEEAQTAKLAEFDAIFQKLDALKIRPAASIAEALAAADPIPPGDAYRLSELEAITSENRALRETVQAAETVEAVRAVNVWWPEKGAEMG